MQPFVFYTVSLRSLPRMAFVCSLTSTLTARSRNVIDHRQNMIELSFASGCERYVEMSDTRYLAPDNQICAFFPDERYTIYPRLAGESTVVWSQSAAVIADDMVYRRHSLDSAGEADAFLRSLPPDTFVLPQIFDPGETGMEQIHRLYHALCVAYMEDSAAGRLRCISEWLRLCAFIDEGFRAAIHAAVSAPGSDPKSAYYYVYKIKRRILGDLAAPVSLTAIAEELGRSPDYIGRLFKAECGVGIHEYVNRQRVTHLQDMICCDRARPLAVLCADVGLNDIRYAQRLFKKYTGVTMQKCRQLSGGLTLYHRNPWHENDLDHDIYAEDHHALEIP